MRAPLGRFGPGWPIPPIYWFYFYRWNKVLKLRGRVAHEISELWANQSHPFHPPLVTPDIGAVHNIR